MDEFHLDLEYLVKESMLQINIGNRAEVLDMTLGNLRVRKWYLIG